MFWRALVAFLVCPGTVALAIPLAWLVMTDDVIVVRPAGVIPLVFGFVALLWCVRDFYVSGKGTLAPWQPPERLVVAGLYRYSRNPMYVAVSLMLLGWAIASGVTGLFFYAFALMAAFQVRVVFAEEPWLARRYGSEWERYCVRVPRWLWKFRRRNPGCGT
jgi:protein-S-isoprenylcysteine O-methyltransferase Ste14